jgi:hypothetical protein
MTDSSSTDCLNAPATAIQRLDAANAVFALAWSNVTGPCKELEDEITNLKASVDYSTPRNLTFSESDCTVIREVTDAFDQVSAWLESRPSPEEFHSRAELIFQLITLHSNANPAYLIIYRDAKELRPEMWRVGPVGTRE